MYYKLNAGGMAVLAERIRELRKALKLSMTEFGRRLGCSRDVIGNIEYKRVPPKRVFVDHLCEVYSVNPAWMYQGDGPMLLEGDDRDAQELREAEAVFRSLSPELRRWAITQMKSMRDLMRRQAARPGQKQNGLAAVELPEALMRTQPDVASRKNGGSQRGDLPLYLRRLIEKRGEKQSALAARAGMAESELQYLLEGRIVPPRDSLLALSVTLGLELEEAQHLLALAGLPALYVKNRRDSVFIFALVKHLSVNDVVGLLQDLEGPMQ